MEAAAAARRAVAAEWPDACVAALIAETGSDGTGAGAPMNADWIAAIGEADILAAGIEGREIVSGGAGAARGAGGARAAADGGGDGADLRDGLRPGFRSERGLNSEGEARTRFRGHTHRPVLDLHR